MSRSTVPVFPLNYFKQFFERFRRFRRMDNTNSGLNHRVEFNGKVKDEIWGKVLRAMSVLQDKHQK